MEIDMPVDGDLWDFQDMWINEFTTFDTSMVGVLANPLIGDFFDSLTITYSDGSQKTVSFSDPAFFDQTAKVNGSGGETNTSHPALNFASWAAPQGSAFVTNFHLKLKQPLQYGDRFTYGFKAQLRSTRHSGAAVAPGTDTAGLSATASATPEIVGATPLLRTDVYTFMPQGHGNDGLTSTANKNASIATGIPTYAEQVPIYATQDERPLGDLYEYINQTSPAGTYAPGGASISMVDVFKSYVAGVSYNAYMVNPALNVIIPDVLNFDANSVKVYIGRGLNDIANGTVTSYHQGLTSTGAADANSPQSYRQLPAGDYTVEEVPNAAANAIDPVTGYGYKVYRITYTGAAAAGDANTGILKTLDDWAMRVDYNLIVPEDVAVQNNLTVRTAWTEDQLNPDGFRDLRGWVSGEVLPDPYDLDGDGLTSATPRPPGFDGSYPAESLPGLSASFDIVVPPMLSSKDAAQGDTGLISWVQDGNTSTALQDSQLARTRETGDIRLTAANGLSTDAAGDLYFKLPTGDFSPALTGLKLQEYDYNTSTSTDLPLPALSYAIADAVGNDPRGLTFIPVASIADIPANAVWVKLTGITVPGYTELRLTESYDIPATASFGEMARNQSYVDISSLSGGHYYSATNYAGFFVSKPAYVINYYKNSVTNTADAANFLGSAAYGDPPSNTAGDPNYVQTGDKVTVTSGTNQGQLDWQRPPAGYYPGVQQGTIPFTVAEGLEQATTINKVAYPANVINVLYTSKSYAVVYDTAGGNPATIPTKTGVSWDEADVVVSPPTRPGYTFTGWMVTDGGFGQMAQPGDAYSDLAMDDNTMSVTLQAQWTRTQYKATILYHLGAPAGSVIGTETVTPVYYQDTIDPTGYLNLHRPAGYNSGVAVEPSWTIADDASANVFNVYYVARNYTVNYNTAGGSPATIASKTGVNYNDASLLPGADPTRPGYTFAGWLVTSGGTQKLVSSADAYKDLAFDENTSAITLTAQWTPVIYTATVIYHSDTPTGTVIGTETIGGLHYQDFITQTGYLGLHRPAGYSAGMAVEPTWIVSDDVSANVFNVYYVPKLYEVDYNLGYAGAAAMTPMTDVTWGQASLLPSAPSRTGYTFAGWKVTAGGPAKLVASTDAYSSLANDENTMAITLTAQWTPIAYTATVRYHLDSPAGTLIGTETITGLNYLDPISQAGYLDLHRPAGYSQGVALDPTWIVSDDVSANVFDVFYPARPYTVTYDSNGGEPALIAPLTNVDWSQAGLLAAEPTKTGFSFTGWKVISGGPSRLASATDAYKDLAFSEDSALITLQAQWTPVAYTATVLYHLDSPAGSLIATETITALNYLDLISQTGYLDLHRPAGYSSGVAVEPSWRVSADSAANIFNVYYTPRSYTVNYNTAGGSPATIASKTGVNYRDASLLPTEPTRPGYSFAGWLVTSGGTQKLVSSADAYKDLAFDENTSAITLTAQWTPVIYSATVLYHKDSPTGSVIATETVANLSYQDLISQTGYLGLHRPLGYLAGVAVEPLWMVSADPSANVFNVYYAPRLYEVDYSLGYAGAAAISPLTDVTWGQASLLPVEPTRAGYTFAGWKVTAGGPAKSVSSSDAYSALANDENTMAVTLTAQWTPVIYTATVIYHSDTPTGTVIGTETIGGLHYQDTIAQAGYLDLHRPAGYSQGVAVDPTWTVSDDVSANVFDVFYTARPYTVTYDTAGGDPATIDPLINVDWSQTALLPEEPTRAGYTFSGWKVTAGGPAKQASATDAYSDLAQSEDSASIVLTAQWKPIDYRVTVLYHLGSPTGSLIATETIAPKHYQDLIDATGYLNLHRPAGYSQGVAVEPSWMVSADNAANVFNVYYAARSYTLSYDTNGGGPASIDPIHPSWNDTGLLPVEPTRPGYSFTGWKVISGGPAKTVADSDSVSTLAFDENTSLVALQAQWTPLDYTVTILYHKDGPAGSVIATETITAKHYQDTIAQAGYLNLHRLTGYQPGVAVEPAWLVSTETSANVFNVYYVNIAPVISVARPALYIEEGHPLSLDEVLRLAGVSVSDTEDSLTLKDLIEAGYADVKWNVVTGPDGVAYTITLNVTDSGGKAAVAQTISIFVEKNDPAQKPVDPSSLPPGWPAAPGGMAWGRDPAGNLELFVIDPAPAPKKASSSGLAKTGDSAISYLMMATLASLGAAGVFITSRKRYADKS